MRLQLVLALGLQLLAIARPTYAFSGDLIDTDHLRRTRVRNTTSWDWDRTWAGWSVNNQPVISILSTVLGSYRFTAPRINIQRGQAYHGSATRLRRVVRHLMNPSLGRPVKIGVIGGSITWGQGTFPRGDATWFSVFSKWLITAFPHANITARNGCTPGVPATYMILCLEQSVDPDVELVFIEFTLNNGNDGALFGNRIVQDMERLVRRVMELPRRPAVVLMHVPTHGMAEYPHGHPKNPNNDTWAPYYFTSEDALAALCQYYDLQSLSMRGAVYDLAVRGAVRGAQQQQLEGFAWEQMFVDIHPGNQGHKVMADLAVYLVQQVALGLLQLPWGPEDQAAAELPLLGPMYEGNLPPSSPMCLVGDMIKKLVVSAQGFEFLNEGTPEKPKTGYVATQPGSSLRLKINTERKAAGGAGGPGGSGEPVMVFFHHLRSYEHMGVARISCVSGCACSPLEVDAHHSEPVSQLYTRQLSVSQHPGCEMEVQVLDRTSSGEHKFKVAGLVISERAGDPGVMGVMTQGRGEGHFGVREHNGDVQQITITRDGRTGGDDAMARRRMSARRRGLL